MRDSLMIIMRNNNTLPDFLELVRKTNTLYCFANVKVDCMKGSIIFYCEDFRGDARDIEAMKKLGKNDSNSGIRAVPYIGSCSK